MMFPSSRTIRDAIVRATPDDVPFGVPLTSDHLAELRAAQQPLLDQLRTEAEHARTTPIPPLPFNLFRLFDETGSRWEYEQPLFERRSRLTALALIALIDQTDAYVPAIEDLLWEIGNEATWGMPAHLPLGWIKDGWSAPTPIAQVVDLLAAETAATLAEVLHLIGSRLAPGMVDHTRAEIERRVFAPVFAATALRWWETAPHNWAAVIGAGVGLAALAIERDRERLSGMIARMVPVMECFLEGYGADGGCAEGIAYWNYGFGHFVYFADGLRAYTGGAIDLLALPQMQRIAAFPARISLARGAFVNFSDTPPRVRIGSGLSARLAQRIGADQAVIATDDPTAQPVSAGRWIATSRNVFWNDGPSARPPIRSGSEYFADLQWAIDRRVVGDKLLAFAAKGGHNGEPHNHNDLGHFILHIDGDSLLCDLGAGPYERDYFWGDRSRFLHLSSPGHSVPVIDGHAQCEGAQYAARVIDHIARDDGLTFALDLTRAYAVDHLQRFERRFEWRIGETSATLDLIDTCAFDQLPTALDEGWISLHKPALPEAGVARWQGERGSVTLRYNADQWAAAIEAIDAHSFDRQPITVFRLRLHARAPQLDATYHFNFRCE